MKILSYGSNFKMPECRTVRHAVSPVPDWKKLMMPEQVRYRTKLTQSGIFLVRYRTKIQDAGMPMPALVSSMPMPSYADIHTFTSLYRPVQLLFQILSSMKVETRRSIELSSIIVLTNFKKSMEIRLGSWTKRQINPADQHSVTHVAL